MNPARRNRPGLALARLEDLGEYFHIEPTQLRQLVEAERALVNIGGATFVRVPGDMKEALEEAKRAEWYEALRRRIFARFCNMMPALLGIEDRSASAGGGPQPASTPAAATSASAPNSRPSTGRNRSIP